MRETLTFVYQNIQQKYQRYNNNNNNKCGIGVEITEWMRKQNRES